MLGQVLINKGLVSETQLSLAIDHQRSTGKKLGEILQEWNLVSQRQLQGALRRQRNLRLAVAVATTLLGPLQAMAVSYSPIQGPVSATSSRQQSGMKPLDEQALREVIGQGFADDRLRQLALKVESGDGLEVAKELAKLMNPALQYLDVETRLKDVVYDVDGARATLNKDGSLTLKLPSTIGELSFNHIRVAGSTGPSMGSIEIKGIDLRGSSITILPVSR
ncbi:hypothetical protein [Chitinivorax sp. B]|uniref:hypothetical protein n=1 Tax=Chitinivorax sp. B TaxID=2502235 RepID=UPI002017FAD4|nr:hypothetical protein [Chitinivorax sp. B]